MKKSIRRGRKSRTRKLQGGDVSSFSEASRNARRTVEKNFRKVRSLTSRGL